MREIRKRSDLLYGVVIWLVIYLLYVVICCYIAADVLYRSAQVPKGISILRWPAGRFGKCIFLLKFLLKRAHFGASVWGTSSGWPAGQPIGKPIGKPIGPW